MTDSTEQQNRGEGRLATLLGEGRGDGLDLRALFRTYWRRRWLIGGVTLLFVLVTALYLAQLRPQYTTHATLMLNSREAKVVDIEAVLSGLPDTDAAILGEIEVIRSRRLLGRVVDKLRLGRDPEFNATLRTPSWRARAKADLKDLLAAHLGFVADYLPADLSGPFQARPATAKVPLDAEVRERLRSSVIGAVRGGLHVRQLQWSQVLEVRFTSWSGAKAALIANTIADQYLVDQLEAKYEATRRATSWLNDRLGDLKTQVAESEAAVEAYKAEFGAGARSGIEITRQQLSQLNTELIQARTARAEAEARYRQLADLVKRRGIEAAAEIVSSPRTQGLRQRLGEAKRSQAELATRYGERHPKMINVRAEIADAEAAVRAEVEKVVEGLRTELRVARSRAAAIERNLQELEGRSIGQSKSSVQLRQLEREAEANRLIYRTFLSRFKETQEQEDLQQADARLISRAERAGGPSYPRKQRALSFALLLGLAAGLGLAFLLERLDNAFRTAEQIEALLGLATLGNLPLVRGRRARRDVLAHVRAHPTSAIAEAVRGLRTALLLSNVDTPPRTVLLTSSLPREGKSTTALLLAETAVKLGRSVAVVDCDLRRPGLHQALALGNQQGLVDVLAGEAELDTVLQMDPVSGIGLLAARPAAENAIELLASRSFEQCLEALKARFDMVILDTAPILAVSDAAVLARHADALLYVVKWAETPRPAVETGVSTLRDHGLKIGGVVLTQIDMRRQAQYGERGYGAHYARYQEYYRERG